MNGGSDMKNADSLTDGDDLRKLVAHAWAAPSMWHGVPDCPLALMITPRGMSSDGPDFEVRDVKSILEAPGYRCARPGKPKRASPRYALHDHLLLDDPPKDEEEFARKVSECLDGWPSKHPAKLGDLPSIIEWSDLPSLIVDWYMSMFGSAKLRFWQRFLVALAGSATFIVVAWFPKLLLQHSVWEGMEEYAWMEKYYIRPLSYLVSIACIPLFAFLCSWKTFAIGPIRLYAISFLFSLLIWTLVTDTWGLSASPGTTGHPLVGWERSEGAAERPGAPFPAARPASHMR